jgi:hypothetical protein
MRGELLYRCRLCGQVYPTQTVHNIELWVRSVYSPTGDLALRSSYPNEKLPETPITHQCADGRIGVADLIGGQPID